ncbi:hypothetical protein [Phaeovulum sp.]|uniref:hypothetical protein n=1 Tax=Phaeovulum sp. TaxID=2934796 RepID=UPI00273090E4|nr:hypothetical protein [Phaeovulum sp.]MDP1668322.1 hypothetical protein [Phaeovulum sp.]MDP2062628.1 hypothetical protein [Phaeovulum sp.]MDP3862780.1 hypothetical protein [Phaeovulum sp.]MDZ4118170.1 hypothetical protein [Phaeovulum sp.]
MKTLRRLWRNNRLALIGFTLAAFAVLFFAARMLVFTIYWSDPAHRDGPIEGWMTPGMLARARHLPPEAVAEALGLDRDQPRRMTLAELAAERGVPLEVLLAPLLPLLTPP